MERYVADLLALSRLEADDFSLELGEVDVAALVEAAAATWTGPSGPGRGRSPSRRQVPRRARAATDADARLRQVLDVLAGQRACGSAPQVTASW